jgi:phenylacetate-CoA ligase
MELLCHWRHYSWFGYKLGMPFLDIRNYSQHLSGHFRWNWKCQSLEISIHHLNKSNIKTYAKLFKRYRIQLWRGHPHAINQLCRYLDNAKIHDVKPKCIITVGEALLAYQRKFIETWAGVSIGDNYGLTEHSVLICQCPEGGYHIATEYGIVEILNEDGTKADFGEEGRIIATGLHNKAFPLLRYDTGDYAVLSNQTCSCGRTLPLVKALTGRIDDHILDANGRWVSSLHRSFKFVNGIQCSQIVQKEFGAIDVYIVPTKDYHEHMKTLVFARLHKELGERMHIQIYTVKELPFKSLKKFKFVINRLKQKTSVSGENG